MKLQIRIWLRSKKEYNIWFTKKSLIEREDLKLLVARNKINQGKKQINSKAQIWNLKWTHQDYTIQLKIVLQKVKVKVIQIEMICLVTQNQWITWKVK
jgi:hypothetical protein